MFGWLFDKLVMGVELAFAGAWDSLVHKGLGWVAIAILLGLAFGSQLLAGIPLVGPILADFFKPLRKDLLWAAFAVALVLGGEYIGARDAKIECEARQVVVTTTVHKKVDKATSPSKTHDPYDDPRN
jgi:hypothetical protein